jgi:short-chain fatty acids transporter
MILGQCWCPSASVYALVASKGHFLEEAIGILSQDLTTYNPINTILFLILAVVTILVGALTKPPANEVIAYKGELTETAATVEEVKITAADKMNGSRILMYLVGIAGFVYIVYSFATNGIIKSLNFNFVIFLFLTLNAFLYNTPHKFVTAFRDSMKPATEVMMQFPFYGGIMGMMAGSGLTKVMADGLIQVATVQTLPLFSYYSSSIVNLFVPSQGGQWIVQGPVLVEAAKSLNADISLVINAFVFGDEATNLIQPLYIIPALSLVGMKLKEVWGFMAFIWLVWFIVTSLGLLVLPGLF